jgi:tetratricopeptide (TPR) repeat protein
LAPQALKLPCLGALGRWSELVTTAKLAEKEMDRDKDAPAVVTFWRGRAQAALGEWKDAEADMSRAAEINAGDKYAWYWLGVARIKQAKFKEALDPLQRTIKLGNLETDAFASYERSLVAAGQPAEAVAVADDGLQRLKVEQSQLSNVHFWRGMANSALGKHREAEGDFTRSLEGEPGSDYSLYWRACMRTMLKEFGPALEDLKQIKKPEELTDVTVDVFTISARCHVELEQWAKAAAAADKAIALNVRLKRTTDKGLFWRGRARLGTKDFAAAAADLAEAAKLAPQHARSRYWLARAYAGEGKHREAVEALEAAKGLEGAEEFDDIDELAEQYKAEAEKASSA